MKRTTVIGLFFLISYACFAQNLEGINSLIRTGLNENFDSISEEAANLNEIDRLEIYNQHKKKLFDRWANQPDSKFTYLQ